jgi:nitrite reductase (NO-forming)
VDPYDESKMDLHPKPASVSGLRHTGAFATGSALTSVPVVGPLDPAPIKTIQIDIVDRVIELAPGVRFSAWTLGGQVPGPVNGLVDHPLAPIKIDRGPRPR